MTAAAIKGEYTNYRLVPSRNVVQCVVEFPAEQQQEMFATLGYPMPGKSIWVAVARLQNPEVGPPPPERPPAVKADDPPSLSLAGATSKVKDLAKSELMRGLYASLTPEERAVADAGRLCKDPAFQKWAIGWQNEEETARWLREECGIRSRRELATNSTARDHFNNRVTEYQIETGQIAEARG